MHDFVPLSAARGGQIVEVRQLVGPADYVRRLGELGLQVGARVEIVRGGSPCIVRVGGCKLCFRDDQQVRVFVSPRKSA